MPEGPEVKVISRALEKAIGLPGLFKVLTHPEHPYKFERDGVPGGNLLADSCTIRGVTTKGKLIILELETPTGIYWGLNTLGMTGSWMWDAPNHIHGRLRFDFPGRSLTFVDPRSFGTFKVVQKSAMVNKLAKIGWDLLWGPAPHNIWHAIRADHQLQTIAYVLTHQRKISGIGNIYRAEIMYRAGVHPLRTVCTIDQARWDSINGISHKVLSDALSNGGSTIQSYTADGKSGSHQDQLVIYQRTTCPLGHKTSTIKLQGRTVWFCPGCQF